MTNSITIKKVAIAATGSIALLALSPFSANAVGIVRIGEDAFTPQAGLITFSEFPVGTVNPVYTPADYGGDATAPIVTFGGFFQGQSLSRQPGIDCPGGIPTGCVAGTATNPLKLDPLSPATVIKNDFANPTRPSLSGSPTFNGPVTILFSKDQAGVGLDGGSFNAPNSTAITAFARDGSVLGQVTNTGLGFEFLGLVTSDGSNAIAGLQFSLVGNEPFGFAIDNLRFAKQGDVIPPTVPEPNSLLGLLVLGGLGTGAVWKRKFQS